MERNKSRVHPSPKSLGMSDKQKQNNSQGRPIHLFSRQESAGNAGWRVLAEGSILHSLRLPLQPSGPTSAWWPPRVTFISNGLSELLKVTHISKPWLVSQDRLPDGP